MQDNSDVSYLSWGIFQVAYDSASPRRSFFQLTDLRAYYKPSHMFLKFLKDLWYLDRWHSSLFYFSTLWIIVAPAFSLYFAHVVISSVSFIFQWPVFWSLAHCRSGQGYGKAPIRRWSQRLADSYLCLDFLRVTFPSCWSHKVGKFISFWIHSETTFIGGIQEFDLVGVWEPTLSPSS